MSRLLLGVIVLAIGALAGWYVMTGGKELQLPMAPKIAVKNTPTPAGVNLFNDSVTIFPKATPGADMEKGGVAARTVVTYSDTGFAPSPVTVKTGSTVTFVNESGKAMWVASAVHPTHELLPGFDQLKSVAKGGTYEYTFVKVGTWKYHNHMSPTDVGTVVVTN